MRGFCGKNKRFGGAFARGGGGCSAVPVWLPRVLTASAAAPGGAGVAGVWEAVGEYCAALGRGRLAAGAERASVLAASPAGRTIVVRQRRCAHVGWKGKQGCRCYCRGRRAGAGCPVTSRAR